MFDIVKFGTCVNFLIAYYGTYILFPSNIVATIMGVCNVIARSVTIFAPYLAHLNIDEISYALYLIFSSAALITSFKIADPKDQITITNHDDEETLNDSEH